MATFKRDYRTDYDINDPELSARWDEVIEDLHASGCPVAGFGVKSPREQEWVNRRLTDHPLAAFDTKLQLIEAWEQVSRKIYVRCEALEVAHDDPLITRLETDDAWTTERWPDAHSPHITNPQRVIDAILAV